MNEAPGDGSDPEKGRRSNPADEQRNAAADELRDQVAEGLADAVAAAQRLADRAAENGFGPELAEGTGDAIYDYVTQQLLTTSRVMRHAQGVAEKLLEATLLNRDVLRSQPRVEELTEEDGMATMKLHVRNDLSVAGTLSARAFLDGGNGRRVELEESAFTTEYGRKFVAPGDETVVKLTIRDAFEKRAQGVEGSAVAGVVEVSLTEATADAGDRARRIARQRFEIWK